MDNKKWTLDDIFDDDDFGLLDSKQSSTTQKTSEDRLIDSFEEINIFFDKNQRHFQTFSLTFDDEKYRKSVDDVLRALQWVFDKRDKREIDIEISTKKRRRDGQNEWKTLIMDDEANVSRQIAMHFLVGRM